MHHPKRFHACILLILLISALFLLTAFVSLHSPTGSVQGAGHNRTVISWKSESQTWLDAGERREQRSHDNVQDSTRSQSVTSRKWGSQKFPEVDGRLQRAPCLASRRQDGRVGPPVRVYLERMGTYFDRKYRLKASSKVPNELFNRSVMQQYGFVDAEKAHGRGDHPDLAIYGSGETLRQPFKVLSNETRKSIFLFRSDVSVTLLDPPHMIHHPNLVAIYKEFTIRSESVFSLQEELLQRFGNKYHIGVLCSSHQFYNVTDCAKATANDATLVLPLLDDQTRSKRIRTVNWNFAQYYEMEPVAETFRNVPLSAQKSLRRERSLDVFCVVHLRQDLTHSIEMHKATILVALSKYTGPKKVHGCVSMNKMIKHFQEQLGVGNDTINHRCLKPSEYTAGMSRAKTVVCPWGWGERTGCDVRAMLLGSVVLKPWMDWVLAYPDIYQSGKYYIGFQPSASDLNAQIHGIIANYDDYSSMRERAQKLCIQKVSVTRFVDRFWAETCDAYTGLLSHQQAS